MKILVIDDERPSRSDLAHLIVELMPQALVAQADCGAKAVELAAASSYDAFFVDINLGDMAGTTLSVMLKQLQPQAQIVFATAYDEYAVKAFEIDATDYIMKPFDPLRVEQALARITARLQGDNAPKGEEQAPLGKLSISCDKRVVVLEVERIAYIETDSRSCVLHTLDGDYTCAQPLSYFEKKLVGSRFFRLHKSFLINLDYVIEITPWMGGMYTVRLRGYKDKDLPVSRKQIKLLREIFDI